MDGRSYQNAPGGRDKIVRCRGCRRPLRVVRRVKGAGLWCEECDGRALREALAEAQEAERTGHERKAV